MADPIPMPTLEPAEVATVDLTQDFSTYTNEMAGSCDVSGAISTLMGEITRSVVDPITGTVTEVTQSAQQAMSEIRSKMAELYKDLAAAMAPINEQFKRAKVLLAEAGTKIQEGMDAAVQQLTVLINDINTKIVGVCNTIGGALGSVLSGINNLLNQIGNMVKNLGMCICSSMTNAIVDLSPETVDQLPESTSAMKNTKSTKGQLDNGVTDQKDLTSAMAKANGMDSTVQGVESSTISASSTTKGTAGQIQGISTAVNNLEIFVGTL